MADERTRIQTQRALGAQGAPVGQVSAAQNTLASLEALQKQLQSDIAASKQRSQAKSVEIPTIALEQAVATGDKTAAVNAAKAVAEAQGGNASARAANAINAIQTATPQPTLSAAQQARGDQIKWVGGVNGSWQVIKGTGGTTAAGGGTDFTSILTALSRGLGGGGGNTGGGLTADQLNAALAAQQAQFNALTQQQAANAEAERRANRIKAKDKLTAMLSAWNLQGLASWIDKQIMDDVSEEMIFINLYEQKEYQQRFPGMQALRKAGRAISEDEYIRIENQMIQTARFFDLPKGFYDSPDDFGKLIGNQVSAKEYQDRLQVGQDLARSLNPSVKQQLIDFYGVGEGDLTAFVLDSDRALPLIQKQAKAAMFVGLGRAAGFTLEGMGARQAEAIAGTESYAKLTEAQLKQSLNQAGLLRREQQRLSQIEGMTYNEQEALDAVIESNPQALLASQQRAQREVARFGARSGLTGASLRGTETAI